ncbi:B12-binding domain-containing radical SAM protein, partial [Candidatus Poribacteria bacterium]|nr:B12-binding domain-containing radical SAM protein [Candidatus Poribacteria bacterium]
MRLAFVFDAHILQHEPLGPMYIASYVRQFGHDVEYFSIDEPDYERLLRNFDPQVLAYSVATGQHPRMIEANQHLRQALPKAKFSLFGGPHPTFFPNMLKAEGVDAICIGEGEEPVGELLAALDKGDDWTRIENLHCKLSDGSILENSKRNFLPNLDDLPFPDHDIKDRFPHLRDKEVGFFIAGRGCPFHCTFCFNDAMMKLQGGRYVRYRDPEKVCEEIEQVRRKYNIKLVSFQDDIFGIDVKWLERFGPIYRERVKLPFMCHYRADLATERAMKAMYEAGCVRLIVGLESGDEDLRQRVMDKRVTDAELLASAERAHRYNIELLTQNMFGIPGETVETALSTIEINVRIKPEVFIHYFFMPYPMTKLGELAQEMGMFDGDFDALPETYHTALTLKLRDARTLNAIGLCSYFLIDYPVFYYLTKYLFKILRPEPL